MPGFLLNMGSTVICAHGGQAQSTAPVPRVRVMGLPVTVQPPPYVIAGCTNPPPLAGVGPCITGIWVVAALRVKAMGMPVLLQDSQAVCAPTGTPLTVVLTQIRVRGI
ncbi:hypothetical protein [Leptolyngbya sp. AN10]|uniref:hypothetical protein n=1 Tax=Leptolyngbya sp. AN10 TaxID=3423365 RepID=UPI003D317E9F